MHRRCAIIALRRFGVDTTKVVRGGNRVGIYFCEKGASQRPSKVVYDRAGASIAEAKKAISIDEIFTRIPNGSTSQELLQL